MSRRTRIHHNNINQLPHNCCCAVPLDIVSIIINFEKAIICNAQLSLHDFTVPDSASSRCGFSAQCKKTWTETKFHPKIFSSALKRSLLQHKFLSSTRKKSFFGLHFYASNAATEAHLTLHNHVSFCFVFNATLDRYLCNFRNGPALLMNTI